MKKDLEILIGSLIIISGITVGIGIVSLLLVGIRNMTGSIWPIIFSTAIVISFFAIYKPKYRVLDNRHKQKKEHTSQSPQS